MRGREFPVCHRRMSWRMYCVRCKRESRYLMKFRKVNRGRIADEDGVKGLEVKTKWRGKEEEEVQCK